MSWPAFIPVQYRALALGVLALALIAAGAGIGWAAQGWRLGEQMAEQGRALESQLADRDRLHAATLAEIGRAAADQERRNQEQRLLLEQQLQASSAAQYGKLSDAEKNAARLRDRLATAELRLSVLIANPGAAGSGSSNALPTPAGAGCLVDGAGRADIDPGAAQRIVGIANRGDRAIIALTACQAYVEKVSKGGG
ncbi:lysis protein [Pseudomonas fulva]|uniref:lysis protein n=1 Tax=Pseudomonas fulva TaxID=47880 RepID=UPI00201D800B|nr:lysis protein [Pseudomonas fulva]UQY33614.1 lysis protein [Pseudomonas fulva]